MARTKGARSVGHEERRASLLRAFRVRLLERNLPPPSLRELAAAAGVTIPTVRHYFGRREDLIVALLQDLNAQGAGYLASAREPAGPFKESVEALVRSVLMGLTRGLSEIHALGLREGLRNDKLGPTYLEQVLEPTILAVEERLTKHQERGEMRSADVRVATIGLIAPLVIAQLHQRELGGLITRPLDIETFAREHIRAFLLAYAVSPDTPGSVPTGRSADQRGTPTSR
jgi:AcrR family transcriptional regulator